VKKQMRLSFRVHHEVTTLARNQSSVMAMAGQVFEDFVAKFGEVCPTSPNLIAWLSSDVTRLYYDKE